MQCNYHFPKTRFVNESGITRQLFHMLSEFWEVVVALLRRDYPHAIHEAYDLIGSCETLIRKMVARSWARGVFVNTTVVKMDVIRKNRVRGYYVQD